MGTPTSGTRQGDKLYNHEVQSENVTFALLHTLSTPSPDSFSFQGTIFVPFFRLYVLWLCNLYTENIHLADCRGRAYTWKPTGSVELWCVRLHTHTPGGNQERHFKSPILSRARFCWIQVYLRQSKGSAGEPPIITKDFISREACKDWWD